MNPDKICTIINNFVLPSSDYFLVIWHFITSGSPIAKFLLAGWGLLLIPVNYQVISGHASWWLYVVWLIVPPAIAAIVALGVVVFGFSFCMFTPIAAGG